MTDDNPTLPDSSPPDNDLLVGPPLHVEVEQRLAQADADIEAAFQRGFETGRDAAEALLISQVEHYRKLCDMYDEEVKRLREKLKK